PSRSCCSTRSSSRPTTSRTTRAGPRPANVPPRRSGTRFRQGARATLFQSSSESGRDMSKIGVHSFVWSAGSSRDALEKALENTHRLGYKLIEFSYLDPSQVDVAWL